MNFKKFIAAGIAVTMVIGSSVTVFATGDPGTGDTSTDASSATGTGTSFDHVDKEVTSVTLPTTDDVADVFDYYIDPERLINSAGTLEDGSTAVTGNSDGVYFKTADDAYASTSKAVTFEGKNSVDVDVSVAATVTGAATDIALVESEDALTAATKPALLMNLVVGSDTKAITSSGATAKATVQGVADNFEVKTENGQFVYKPKDDASGWKSTTVQLSGKTNTKDVPKGEGAMTAPQITLTWTIDKHVDSYASATTVSSSSNAVTVTLPEGVTVSKVQLSKANGTTVNISSPTHYSVSGTTYTFERSMVSSNSGGSIVITYSDNHTDTLTIS